MARTNGSRNLTPGIPGGKQGQAKINGKPVKSPSKPRLGAGDAATGHAYANTRKQGAARKAKTPTSKGRAKYVNPSNPTR